MTEMQLNFVFRGLGFWRWDGGRHFCIVMLGDGNLALAFFPRSHVGHYYLAF